MDMDASIDQVIQGLGSDAFDGSKYDLDCNDGQPTSGAREYDVEDTSLSSPKIIEMVSRTQPEHEHQHQHEHEHQHEHQHEHPGPSPNPNPNPDPTPDPTPTQVRHELGPEGLAIAKQERVDYIQFLQAFRRNLASWDEIAYWLPETPETPEKEPTADQARALAATAAAAAA